MVELLTTSGTAHYLEQVIKKAKKDIYIVSPYLDLSHNFLQRLLDAEKSGKTINIVYRDDKLKERERKKVEKIRRLNLYHHPFLHAKCYANEEFVIITSMNMIEYSEKKNRELGILVRKDQEENTYNEAIDEIISIIDDSDIKSMMTENPILMSQENQDNELNSTEKEIKNMFSYAFRIPVDNFKIDTSFKDLGLKKGLNPEKYWDSDIWELGEAIDEFIFSIQDKFHINLNIDDYIKMDNLSQLSKYLDELIQQIINSIKPNKVGYCIRDGIRIPFNTKHPLCDRAFKSWNKFKNYDYEESYCHKTGKPSNGKTSFRNPVLYER